MAEKGTKMGRGRETPSNRGRGWFGRGTGTERLGGRGKHEQRDSQRQRKHLETERKDSKDLEFRERHPWRDRERRGRKERNRERERWRERQRQNHSERERESESWRDRKERQKHLQRREHREGETAGFRETPRKRGRHQDPERVTK